jgi:RHS repeat-associated protein
MGNPVPLNSWGTPHSAIANPYIFTGQRLDEESGLYFYRARYYDAFEGRFYQRDPREYVDGMNLYEYVADRPTFAADPLGTQKLSGSTVVIQGAPPIWGPCGGFLWPIRWALDAASKAGGWIVQKVNVRFNVTDCDGKKIDIKTLTNGRVDPGWWPFWEAWRVDKGQTQTTLAQIGRPADDFYGSEVFGACTKGDVQIEGTAQFYEGLTLPPDFKVGLALLMPNPMNPFTALLFYDTAFLPSPAGFLPATKAEPKLMGGTGVIKHNLKAAWNCCPVGHIENTVGGTYVGK